MLTDQDWTIASLGGLLGIIVLFMGNFLFPEIRSIFNVYISLGIWVAMVSFWYYIKGDALPIWRVVWFTDDKSVSSLKQFALGCGLIGIYLTLSYIVSKTFALSPFQLATITTGVFWADLVFFSLFFPPYEENFFSAFLSPTVENTLEYIGLHELEASILGAITVSILFAYFHLYAYQNVGQAALHSAFIFRFVAYFFQKRWGAVPVMLAHMIINLISLGFL